MKLLTGLMLAFIAFAAVAETNDAAVNEPELLPAWLIELPQSVESVLVADTDNATMHRFTRRGAAVTWSDERYMSIGTNGIRKQKAWDKKTPLGAYFITEHLDTSRMHDKYGVAAYPIDYPNAWDRYNGRTGYGIWLHGVDRNHPIRPPLDTGGCLALPNGALLQIAQYLVPLVTPLIVAPKMVWAKAADIESTRLAFRDVIEQWQRSLLDGDLLSYLSLYSPDFRHGAMDKAKWSAYRLQVFESRRIEQLEIRDLLLLADPGEPDIFLSRFTQLVATDHGAVTTTKRLYWKRDANNHWKIVSEGAG